MAVTPTLLSLPLDLHYKVAGYLSLQSCARLACVSKFFAPYYMNDNVLKERFTKWHFVVETKDDETVVLVCKRLLCIKQEFTDYCHDAGVKAPIKTFAGLSDNISPQEGSVRFDEDLHNSQKSDEGGSYVIEYWAFLAINDDQAYFLEYAMNNKPCPAGPVKADNAELQEQIVLRLRAFLIRATVIGSPRCLKVILNNIPLINTADAYISYALESAADHGHNNCLQAIINYLHLHNLTCDDENIQNALKMSAEGGHTDCLQTLIDWPQFSKSSVKLSATANALGLAVIEDHKECVQAIIDCSWFNEILLGGDNDNVYTLSSALIIAAEEGHAKCLQALVDCSQFREISGRVLRKAWQAAETKGHTACLEVFCNCWRSYEIIPALKF